VRFIEVRLIKALVIKARLFTFNPNFIVFGPLTLAIKTAQTKEIIRLFNATHYRSISLVA